MAHRGLRWKGCDNKRRRKTNDARALCFMWLCSDSEEQADLVPLRRSAELGYALAQAWMAGRTRGLERFKFVQLAAMQGDRDGFFRLGFCARVADGCEQDLNKAKENFLRASQLGDVYSMSLLGWLFDDLDPQRWRWWGKAAALGISWSFLSNFWKQVESFHYGTGSGAVVLSIGWALQGHVSEQASALQNKLSHSMMRKSKQRKLRCMHGLKLASS
jgi:hypothetical protein